MELPSTRSIAEGFVAMTAAAASTPRTIPFTTTLEIGSGRIGRFLAALRTLRVFFAAHSSLSPTDAEPTARAGLPTLKEALAALKDTQSLLEQMAVGPTVSYSSMAATWGAVLDTLLSPRGCCAMVERHLTSTVSGGGDQGDGAAMSSPHAAELVARILEVLLIVVDGCCAIMHAGVRDGVTVPFHISRVLARMWDDVAAHAGGLLRFSRAVLASSTRGPHSSGSAVQASLLRLLDSLLLTCTALLKAHAGGSSPDTREGDVDSMRRIAATAADLGRRIAAPDVLRAAAGQLEAAVQVLDEVDPVTRKTSTYSYDVLRHGPLPVAGEMRFTNAMDGERVGAAAAAAVPGKTPWTPLDSTRPPLSPLELHACTLAFLAHAAAFSAEQRGSQRDREPPVIDVAVWRGYVSLLARALQEGETALTFAPAPTLTSPLSQAERATQEAAKGTNEMTFEGEACLLTDSYFSPLLPRVWCGAVESDRHATMPFAGDLAMESEPATPCQSPVVNGRAYSVGRETDSDARGAVMREECPSKTPSAVATAAVEFPSCPAAAAAAASLASATAGEADVPARQPPRLSADDVRSAADTNVADGASALPTPCTSRGACNGGADSTRHTETTLAGITDVETLSLYGGSCGVASLTHSQPVPIMHRKTSAATAGGSGGGGVSTLSPSAFPASPSSLLQRRHAHAARHFSPASSALSPTRHSAPATTTHNSNSNNRRNSLLAGSPSPRQLALCKSAASPTASAASPRQSALMEPLSLPAAYRPQAGSSKSSCLMPETRVRRQVPNVLFIPPTPVLRADFPSDPRLTKAALASLVTLTEPAHSSVASMTALAQAGVLRVMSELLEYPGSTPHGVVTAALENCFAFWEAFVVTQLQPFLGGVVDAPAEESMTQADAHAGLPPPLHALLHTFGAFLGWNGEGWAALHSRYLTRALRVLVSVLDRIKAASTVLSRAGRRAPLVVSSAAGTACAPPLLTRAVYFLLSSGVIGHVWRCLSMDATQIPGAMGYDADPSTAASGKGDGATAGARVVLHYTANMYGFRAVPTATAASAILSEAQCTAMHLLDTLAKSLDWAAAAAAAAVPADRHTQWGVSPGQRSGHGVRVLVPDAATYHVFMEESFRHLAACANCLRRCTYTRSTSRPLTASELEALGWLLSMLRVVFQATEARNGAAAVPTGPRARTAVSRTSTSHSAATTPPPCAARETTEGATVNAAALQHHQHSAWAQQITDSQVLDVLAHIGTAAELVSFPLPRMCLFTLRSYLAHAHALKDISNDSSSSSWTAGVGGRVDGHRTATTATATAAHSIRNSSGGAPLSRPPHPSPAALARARVSMAALQALVADPPPLPVSAGVSTWGRSSVRESLLVILLARMQRRCAGQSANASELLRTEVMALLIDLLSPLVETLPCALSDASRSYGGGRIGTALASDLLRLAQRVVAAVISCRLWSSTAQEVRYLDPANTSLAKESLRLLYRVAQLVNGSVYAFLHAPDEPAGSEGVATVLGRRNAAVLMAESVTVSFGFHAVTMDFSMALAGLINGTRWHTGSKPVRSAATLPSSTSMHTRSSASSVKSGGGVSSAPSTASSAGSAGRAAVASMKAITPPLIVRPREESSEFDSESRREMCEVAACALVEVLCSLRRMEALLVCSAPLTAATLDAITPIARAGGGGGGSSSSAGDVRHETARLRLPAIPPDTASAAAVLAELPWTQQHQQQEVVVVMHEGSVDFAGLVTSTSFPLAVAALALSPRATPSPASRTDTPAVEESPSAAGRSTTTAPPNDEDPRNWRKTEAQWRRRLTLLRSTKKDALQALDLAVLDAYLSRRSRYRKRDAAAEASRVVGESELEDAAAEEAMAMVATEKKRFLEEV